MNNATANDAPRGMVFRDAAERTTFGTLARAARLATVRTHGTGATRADLVDALLAVSSYETALSDEGRHLVAARVAGLCDALAASLANTAVPWGDHDLTVLDPGDADPLPCTLKRCEGFAYYALRPTDVLAGVSALLEQAELGQASRIMVLGIRTIGTALSALVASALRSRWAPSAPQRVLRITVRPTGHPYDRRLEPPASIADAGRGDGTGRTAFVIVDEGPGLSGSSFLSVAEWLQRQGVPPTRILLHGSRTPDPDALVTPNGAARWRRYRFVPFGAPAPRVAVAAAAELSGGRWREHFGIRPLRWPPVWPAMEREKRLREGPGGVPCVEKFEGLGDYGSDCALRAAALGNAGFGPEVIGHDRERGTIMVRLISTAERGAMAGTGPDSRSAVHPQDRLAAYCAFRATTSAFHAAATCQADQTALWQALTIDSEQELGATLPPPDHSHDDDHDDRPLIVTDGRMQPHEWIATADGILMKVDATSHGDDHFWPGPTDIAWDLAGAIVEWNMRDDERLQFLTRYAALAGERPRALRRVRLYEAAYCAFRAAYCGMAIHATQGDERHRWVTARQRQRTHGRRALEVATGE